MQRHEGRPVCLGTRTGGSTLSQHQAVDRDNTGNDAQESVQESCCAVLKTKSPSVHLYTDERFARSPTETKIGIELQAKADCREAQKRTNELVNCTAADSNKPGE